MSRTARIGTMLVNDEGKLGFALIPPCQSTVKHIEIDTMTGELRVRFDGEEKETFMGMVEEQLIRDAANREHEIMVAHFATLEDFAAYEPQREYTVPLI